MHTHEWLGYPPVLIDSEDRVVCDQAVVVAAQIIGLNSIPVICVDHLSDEQLRAYAIKANRIADLAGYDEALLALELNENNQLLDVAPDILPEQAVSKPDDLWLIGEHRLYNGDALIKGIIAFYCALSEIRSCRNMALDRGPPERHPTDAIGKLFESGGIDFLGLSALKVPRRYWLYYRLQRCRFRKVNFW